jgi:hypothetical protein
MKKIILAVLAFVAIAGFNNVEAQKVALISGEATAIKKEKSINIVYDYSEFGVGKFKTEAEYVKSKKDEYNKDEAGKGDKWEAAWIGARATRYQPKFEELLNEGVSKKGMKFSVAPDAKYTLSVKTTFLEPGFNVGVMKKPAYVSFQYVFYETSDPTKIVATYNQEKVPGSQFGGYDFDVSSRVAESYAKGGKMLGAVLAK